MANDAEIRPDSKLSHSKIGSKTGSSRIVYAWLKQRVRMALKKETEEVRREGMRRW